LQHFQFFRFGLSLSIPLFSVLQIQPIPTEESLQQKLQDKTNWDAYKSMTVSNFIVVKKQLHEHGLDALFL
jgi:hypothetical protein